MSNGIGSRGWGSTHDGETISVVGIEKREFGSVKRGKRKCAGEYRPRPVEPHFVAERMHGVRLDVI